MKPQEKILEIANDKSKKWRSLGDIYLEYGAVVICDPLSDFESKNRVQRTVESGSYHVSVLEEKTKKWGNRFAFAQIVFSEEDIKKVILAKFVSNESFQVSSGLACFMDILTCDSYIEFVNKFYQKNKKGNLYDDFFKSHFKKNADKNSKEGDWVNFTIPKTKNNIIMFHSGMGDGFYKAYWAMGKGNKTCRLIIDFNLLCI